MRLLTSLIAAALLACAPEGTPPMPTAVIPVDSFDTVIPAPDDGEAITRASVVQYVQPMVNRSEALKDRIESKRLVVEHGGLSVANLGVVPGTVPTTMATAVFGGTETGDVFSITFSVRVAYAGPGFNLTSVFLTAEAQALAMPSSGIVVMDGASTTENTKTLTWNWQYTATATAPHTFEFFINKSVAGADLTTVDASYSIIATRDVGTLP